MHILKGNIKKGYIILMGKNGRESNSYLQGQGKICSRGQQECAFNSYNRNIVIRKEKLFLQLKFLSASKEWLLLISWQGYANLFFVIPRMQRRKCRFHYLLLDYPNFFFSLLWWACLLSKATPNQLLLDSSNMYIHMYFSIDTFFTYTYT